MKLSEYIRKLQEALDANGDREVYTRIAFDDTEACTSPIENDDEVIHIMDISDAYCENPAMLDQYLIT